MKYYENYDFPKFQEMLKFLRGPALVQLISTALDEKNPLLLKAVIESDGFQLDPLVDFSIKSVDSYHGEFSSSFNIEENKYHWKIGALLHHCYSLNTGNPSYFNELGDKYTLLNSMKEDIRSVLNSHIDCFAQVAVNFESHKNGIDLNKENRELANQFLNNKAMRSNFDHGLAALATCCVMFDFQDELNKTLSIPHFNQSVLDCGVIGQSYSRFGTDVNEEGFVVCTPQYAAIIFGRLECFKIFADRDSEKSFKNLMSDDQCNSYFGYINLLKADGSLIPNPDVLEIYYKDKKITDAEDQFINVMSMHDDDRLMELLEKLGFFALDFQKINKAFFDSFNPSMLKRMPDLMSVNEKMEIPTFVKILEKMYSTKTSLDLKSNGLQCIDLLVKNCIEKHAGGVFLNGYDNWFNCAALIDVDARAAIASLIQSGLDGDQISEDGRSLVQYAEEFERTEISAIFRSAQARKLSQDIMAELLPSSRQP